MQFIISKILVVKMLQFCFAFLVISVIGVNAMKQEENSPNKQNPPNHLISKQKSQTKDAIAPTHHLHYHSETLKKESGYNTMKKNKALNAKNGAAFKPKKKLLKSPASKITMSSAPHGNPNQKVMMLEECCKQCCGGLNDSNNKRNGALTKLIGIEAPRTKRMAGICPKCKYHYTGADTNYCGDCQTYIDLDETGGDADAGPSDPCVGYTQVSESIICSDCTSEGGCENLSRLYKRAYTSGFCVWRNGECEYDEDDTEEEDTEVVDVPSSPDEEDPCKTGTYDELYCHQCTSETGCERMSRLYTLNYAGRCSWENGQCQHYQH